MFSSSALLTPFSLSFFFFNDTATTEIYTLSLHDALPIYIRGYGSSLGWGLGYGLLWWFLGPLTDRKSTRLNSSHLVISYAVFCLKKKKKTIAYESLADEQRLLHLETDHDVARQ